MGANRLKGDIQIRHCDQAWHYYIRGVALDENGLHAATVEEGLLWVWMQTERDRELLEVNPDSSWGNGSYY